MVALAEQKLPSFPPLLSGVAVEARDSPLARAATAARTGDWSPGTVYWSPDEDALSAALLLAPDRPLGDAMLAVFAVSCGLHDCVGALAPPETAVTHLWPDRILVNGAACGAIGVAVPETDPETMPAWLAVSVGLQLAPIPGDPGDEPGRTSLAEEGCGDLGARELIESWARHTLVWIHRWMEDGPRALHDSWIAHAEGHGDAVTLRHGGETVSGKFLGVDERGNLLLEAEGETRELALSKVLVHPAAWPPEPRP